MMDDFTHLSQRFFSMTRINHADWAVAFFSMPGMNHVDWVIRGPMDIRDLEFSRRNGGFAKDSTRSTMPVVMDPSLTTREVANQAAAVLPGVRVRRLLFWRYLLMVTTRWSTRSRCSTRRAIGWLTGQEKGDGQLEFGGWIRRYDLAPLGPSETAVTLTYDWSAVPQFIRDRGIKFPPFGPEHLTNSLHHLAELAAVTSRA
jgi:hypothetical protein